MADQRPMWLAAGAAFVVGLLLALFFVFRTLFTDGPADLFAAEYLVAHGLTGAAYAVAAALATRLRPRWGVLAWLAAPGVTVALLYMDPPLALRLLTLLAVGVGLGIGWGLGRLWRQRATTRAE